MAIALIAIMFIYVNIANLTSVHRLKGRLNYRKGPVVYLLKYSLLCKAVAK